MVDDIADLADNATEQVIRLPSGVVRLVRQSIDSRERVLDWMLAFAVAGTMLYVFWDQVCGLVAPSKSANAGLTDSQPNYDGKTMGGDGVKSVSTFINYNMPSSRRFANRVGPSNIRIPDNPQNGPQFEPYDPAIYKGS
jgi:hypothetical protein